MLVTIAERRGLASRANVEPAFRGRLLREPRSAVAEVLGRSLPASLRIEAVEEDAQTWSFVLPETARIKAALPEPTDGRTAVENGVYASPREDPAMAARIVPDPVGFLERRFGIALPAVKVRPEPADSLILVLPYARTDPGLEPHRQRLDRFQEVDTVEGAAHGVEHRPVRGRTGHRAACWSAGQPLPDLCVTRPG